MAGSSSLESETEMFTSAVIRSCFPTSASTCDVSKPASSSLIVSVYATASSRLKATTWALRPLR